MNQRNSIGYRDDAMKWNAIGEHGAYGLMGQVENPIVNGPGYATKWYEKEILDQFFGGNSSISLLNNELQERLKNNLRVSLLRYLCLLPSELWVKKQVLQVMALFAE